MNSKSLKFFGITFLVVVFFTYKLRIEGHEAYTEEKNADKPTQLMRNSQKEEIYGKSRKNNDEHHEKRNVIGLNIPSQVPERKQIEQDNEKNVTYPSDFRKRTKKKIR